MKPQRGISFLILDMASPGGQAVVRRLAERSDIVLENFKAGALGRYGLDAASLRAIQPSQLFGAIAGTFTS